MSQFTLYIPKRRTAPKERTKKSSGTRFGLGVCTWLCMIFESNERAQKSKKLTDEMIAQLLIREYPNRAIAHKILTPNVKPSVNSLRGRYNRGELNTTEPPVVFSFRYNDEGQRVDGRTGTRLLTRRQQQDMIAHALESLD